MRSDRRRKLPIKSSVGKHSIIVNGRDSSVSIEGAFWNALKEIAVAQNISANALVSKIDSERERGCKLIVGHPCVCSRTLSARRSCDDA